MREGWLCPQCKRVWAPHIDRCLTCEKVATGGHGIELYTKYDDTKEGVCDAWDHGICLGTKEREVTDCKGYRDKCDKKVPQDTVNLKSYNWECITNNDKIRSYFRPSDFEDNSDWR